MPLRVQLQSRLQRSDGIFLVAQAEEEDILMKMEMKYLWEEQDQGDTTTLGLEGESAEKTLPMASRQ